MGHLDSILVDARPLMVSHNFYICEISSWDSTKNPGITLVFSSPGGLRIDMAINIRRPSLLRLDRLLPGDFTLVQMMQSPYERPDTVGLYFAHLSNPEHIKKVRYLPIDTKLSFFSELPVGEGVFVNDFTPTTVLEVFMKKWQEKYSECIKQHD